MWARASLFRRFIDTNLYGNGSVKMWQIRHAVSVDMRILLYSAVSHSFRGYSIYESGFGFGECIRDACVYTCVHDKLSCTRLHNYTIVYMNMAAVTKFIAKKI